METKNQEAKYLHVIDSSCTEEAQERTHEIVVKGETIPITFKYGEKTVLPFEQGVKFMKDGFTVEQVSGETLDLPAVASDNVVAQIGHDETVAKYSELTTAALKLRAAQKAGGEIYLEAEEEDRPNIIEFLAGKPPVDDEENLIDEDDEDTETVDPEPTVDATEENWTKIQEHFGAQQIVGFAQREEDGVVINKALDVDGNIIVVGTFLELWNAVITGASADRFNSDQDAAGKPTPATVEALEAEGVAENPNPETREGEAGNQAISGAGSTPTGRS